MGLTVANATGQKKLTDGRLTTEASPLKGVAQITELDLAI